jgi:peptidoglycan/xylan/chitin deacetylase (PgdA/CDA1 family)
MSAYPVKTPRIIQSIFRKYKWCFPTDKNSTSMIDLQEVPQVKEIYLTFDDGPIPEITPWVLKKLAEYKAKATFFCVGENVSKHPEIFRKIISEEHAIGNHTNNHLNGWRTNKKTYLYNIGKAEDIFSELAGKNQQPRTRLFRPPYGKIKPNQANKILKNGYDIIMWDVLSGDFDLSLSKENCLKNVLKNANSGSIVVFHDSEKAFKNLEYVLPRTLEYFTEKGFVFKAI